MATSGVLEIDAKFLKQLKEADNALNKISETSQKMKGNVVKWMQDINKDGVMPFYNHLKQLEQKYRSTASTFENVRGYKRFSQQAKKAADSVQKLMQEIAKSPAYQAKVESLTRAFKYEQIKKYGDTSKQAFAAYNRLYSSKGVRSLNNMHQTIRQLADAQSKLNLRTSEGMERYNRLGLAIQRIQKDINNATNTQSRFNNKVTEGQKKQQELSRQFRQSNSRLLNTTDQLQRKLALLVSVSAVQGYINKLISIRKEFELQHKSLGILIQDKDKADELWNKTIALAVQSPFRVKQLVTYTKQLAAYRIETEKLHDTTKMLADVSAGVGVDMQRLILAYGQVRAANFLRGTELRQFTEAGIPMLDELAKHFEELRGKAVSVGDVFEMISKRKVSFKDVDAVFQKMTQEGGVFYKMQEQQSKTLYGMISNLHDSIDLMLNDIGKSNDGVMKSGVEVAKSLVDNWRAFATVLKIVGASMLALQVAQFRSGWIAVSQAGAAAAAAMNGTAGAAARLRLSMTILGNTLKAHPILAIISIIAAAGFAVSEYADAIDEQNKKYDEESARNIRKIDELESINKKITKNNVILEENQKILNDASSSESELAKAKEETTKATKENAEYLKRLRKEYPSTFNAIVQQTNGTVNLNKEIQRQNDLLRQNIALQQQAKGGWFKDSFDTNYKETVESQADVTSAIDKIRYEAITARAKLDEYHLLSEKEKKDVEVLLKKVAESTTYDDARKAYSDLLNYGFTLKKFVSKYRVTDFQTNFIGDISDAARELDSAQRTLISDKDNFWSSNIKEQMNTIDPALSQITGDWSYQMRGKWIDDYLDKMGVVEESTRKWLKDMLKIELAQKKIYVDYGWQWLFDEGAISDLAEWQLKYNEFVQGLHNIGIETITDYKTTREELRKSLKEQAEDAKAIIDSYQVEGQIVYTQEEFEEAKQLYSDLGKAYVAAGGNIADFEKKNKKDKTETIKILNKRIALVKELNTKYEELREHYGEEKAQARVMESYADTFKEAFEGTGINFKGLVVDENKLQEIKNQGEVSGQVFSEEMMKKIEEVTSSGTYIRGLGNLFDATKEQLKKHEGFRGVMYSDSTGMSITSPADLERFFTKSGERKRGSGTLTIGYGHAIQNLKEAEKYLGVTLSQEEAESLLVKDMREREGLLNNLLDKHNQLLVTQEQYGVLFNNYYQGGLSAALKRAERDISETQTYIDKLDQDLQKMGTSFANEFGANWIEEYEKLETYAEKVAKQLEISALTTVDKNGHIDPALYKGMKSRSAERAASFRGDLDVVNMLYRASVDVSQIDFKNIEGVVATLRQLAPIAAKEGKEAQLALSKAISEFEVQIGIKAEVIQDKALTDLVEGMFADYEMSIELEKLNFPKDIASEVFGLDSLSLSDIRKELERMRPQFDSKKQIEEWNNYIKKVDELEEKTQLERLKKYSQYLVKGMNERVKLKYEEAKQLAEIESLNYTPEQEKIIKDSVREETQKKMDKLDWEDFKNSEVYIRIFQDLERVSTKTLKTMRDKLVQMKGQLKNLDPTEVKAIVDALAKYDAEISKRNPYKTATLGLGKYFKALSDTKKLEKKLLEGQQTEESLNKRFTDRSEELGEEEAKLKAMEKSGKVGEVDLKQQRDKVSLLQQQVADLQTQLEIQRKLNGETGQSLDDAKNFRASFTGSWAEIGSDISNAASALPQMAADVENVFGVMDARTKDTIESISEIGNGVGSAIQGFASQNYIQAAAGVLQVIGGIAAIGDKKKERQIQREKEKVEELQRQYEKLEEVISYSYNIDAINSNYEAAKKNLEDQIKSTQEMRRLEEDKKKTDQAKIKEYTQQIEDYQKQLQELEYERINQLGGIAGGDAVKSASENFVNAWIDAFKETGDGLSGLEEQFDEVFMNLVKKQVLGRGVDKMLEPLYKNLEGMLYDGAMDEQDYADFFKDFNTKLPQIDEFLTKMVNDLGIADDITKKTGELSGLQSGIQGITEDQADILAAYWSSVRFIVSNIEQKFTEYARQMLGSDANANPILGELKEHTRILNDIDDKLGSIIGYSGGAHVKTYLMSQ